jgi:SAM-dependent methyltransferase
MRREQLEEMSAVESDHWWFTGKRLFMRRLLGSHLRSEGTTLRILDIGCGTGANAVELSRYGEVIACDRSLDALGMAAGRGVRRLCAASAPDLPFGAGTFDVITAFDIIEHVDDDAGFVCDLERVLMPGGALAIHVPAWPSLWSHHDEILEHKRRYTYRSLRALLQNSDLRIEHLGWASCALFLPTAVVRWTRRLIGGGKQAVDLGLVPRPVNTVLRAAYRVEAALATTVGLPFGVSLAAIAVKPHNSSSGRTS